MTHLQTLLKNLMVNKPEDPIQHLINLLKWDSVDGKIFVIILVINP